MKTDYIDEIKSTPTLLSKKCRTIAFLIGVALQYTSIVTAILNWYIYDIYAALATLLIMFIVMGIIRSKLRNSAIPMTQNEHYYNDMEIARWYTSKEICDDILEQRLEKI